MTKKILLPILSLVFFFVFATGVEAANFSFSPASGSVDPDSGGQIKVQVDSGGENLESATAVITYDSSEIDITNIEQGSYFTVVNTDISTSGEVVVTGNVTFGDQIGVSGQGTLATLTVDPKVNSGSFGLSYRCSASASDDSNIIEIENKTNLLASDDQCESNGSGSYTIEASSNDPTQAATSAPSNDDDDDSKDDTTDTSSNNTSTTTDTSQPAMPESLPQSGPEDWLKWLTSGLALIGVGLLLL
jgi:hypothetical protein